MLVMTTDYRYQLETRKLTGRSQHKTTCPQCGRRKCFVRYVDLHNDYRYLSDEVGRCDHEQSCGYHYKPSEFFQDHPWRADNTPHHLPRQRPTPPPPLPLQPLSMNLVERSHSTRSAFWQWFAGDCTRLLGFDPQTVLRIYDDYRIGATRHGEVIFWQIDELQRVRSGHIMPYGPDGHRQGWQSWTHSRLEKRGELPEGYQLQQCLFGQHLLPQRPDAVVCIVESEKTALVMAGHCPEHLWLATCGSSGLNADKLECLRGRRFTLFPDSGCYEKWQKAMQQTSGLQYNIDGSMEAYPPNTDLADLLLH